MKKLFFFWAFAFVLITSVFGQTRENITYFDIIQNRNVTVNVTFFGWEQNYMTIINPGRQNTRVHTYTAVRVTPEMARVTGLSTEWSDWELTDNEPRPFVNVNSLIELRNQRNNFYRSYSKAGWRVQNFVYIFAVPNGRTTPVWFDENDDLHQFFHCYIIN